jgi:hypothetical protein
MLRIRIFLIILLLNFLILLSGCTLLDNSPPSENTELVLVGPTGEMQELTLDEILDLRYVSGISVYQNSFSFWQGEGLYTGVPLSVFAELIGGILPGDILIVSTVDNYTTQIFSYENLYPSDSINKTQGIIILAYEFNNKRYPDWEDGLRIAFLPEDEEFSNNDSQSTASLESSISAAGPRWSKYVNRLEFRREKEQVQFIYDGMIHRYSWTQILRFTNYTASGGILFSNGSITETNQYTGVNLSHLVHLANRSGSNLSVEIHSTNGIPIILNSTQLKGIIPQYNSSGMSLDTENQVTFLLAYLHDCSTFNEGPFSLVVVGSNSPITDSLYWLSQVDRISLIY